MSPPDSQGPVGLQPPQHDPSVSVAGDKAGVAVHNLDAVDLGSVTAEDVAGLRSGKRGRLALDMDGHGRSGRFSGRRKPS